MQRAATTVFLPPSYVTHGSGTVGATLKMLADSKLAAAELKHVTCQLLLSLSKG